MKKAFNRFRENRELIFGYSSFFGLVITLVYTIVYATNAIWKGQWDAVSITSIICLSAVNISLACGWIYTTRNYDKLQEAHAGCRKKIEELNATIKTHAQRIESEIKKQREIAKIVHNVSHENRRTITRIHSCLMAPQQDHLADVGETLKKFVLFFVTNVKTVFDILTGDNCGVCIKLLDADEQDSNNAFVRTYVRDPISYRERSAIDAEIPCFSYKDNTAFEVILNTRTPQMYFLSNDLEHEENYRNIRQNWQKFYNACLVVPIQAVFSEPPAKRQSNVIGFLCIDNFKGGFRRDTELNLAAAFADGIFHVFRAFNDLKRLANSAKKTPKKGGTSATPS